MLADDPTTGEYRNQIKNNILNIKTKLNIAKYIGKESKKMLHSSSGLP